MSLFEGYEEGDPVSPDMMSRLLKLYSDDEDVYYSLQNYPHKVFMCYGEECCKCGGTVVNIHFRTTPYSWEHLFGREGFMKICSSCKRRLSMIIVIMN